MKNPELNKLLGDLPIHSSISDIIEKVKDNYPNINNNEILSLPLLKINELIISIEDDDFEDVDFSKKHCPTRKKRAKRLFKKHKKTYKKEKDESITKTRKRVEEDVTNRSYINKASKSFVPNRKI